MTYLLYAILLALLVSWLLLRQSLNRLFHRVHVLGRDLEPSDLGCRASPDPHFSWRTNTHEAKITECLCSRKSFLLIGAESSGKSSALLRCLRTPKAPHVLASIALNSPVLPPYGVGPGPGHIIGSFFSLKLRLLLLPVPSHWNASHWIVINLTPRMATGEFFDTLRRLQETRLPIAATCRQEELAEIAAEDRTHQLEEFERIQIPPLSAGEGQQICATLGLPWQTVEPSFNGTIGSIVHAGKPVRDKVAALPEPAKAVLVVLNDLHLCGMEEDAGLFALEDARQLWLSRNGEAADFDLLAELLVENEILIPEDNLHQVSLDLLSVAAGPEHQAANPSLILELKGVFAADGQALCRLGMEAKRLRLYETAIECFKEWHRRSGNVFALLYVGQVYGLLKDYSNAIGFANQAMHSWSWRWWIRQRVRTYAHTNLGTYYSKAYEDGGCSDQSLRSAAERGFRLAQVISPGYAPGWYRLGAFYLRLAGKAQPSEQARLNADAELYLRRGAELERFENPKTNWRLEKVLEANGKNPQALAVLQEMEARTRESVPRAMVLSQMSGLLIELHDEQQDEQQEAHLLQQAVEKANVAVETDAANRFAWQNLIFASLLASERLDRQTVGDLSEIFKKAKARVPHAEDLTAAVRGSVYGWIRRRIAEAAFESRVDFDVQLATWNTIMEPPLGQTAEKIQSKILQRHPEICSSRGYQIVFGQADVFGRGSLA